MLHDEFKENPLVFRGDDNCASFVRFMEDLRRSLPTSNEEDMIDLVPTRLYGNALRVYEGLSAECQQSWGDLMFAMTFSFPGWVRPTSMSSWPNPYTDTLRHFSMIGLHYEPFD